LNAGNHIESEGAIKLSETLESNSTLTSLELNGNRLVASFHSLNTDNFIDTEGGIKLFEALKSNSFLSSLILSGNRLVAAFHSHSIQAMTLIWTEASNYVKCSYSIQLSLHSI